MKVLLVSLAVVGLGCEISPVVTDPAGPRESDRYSECRRASREYCREVVEPADEDMKRCVAEAVYNCVTGGPANGE